MSQLYWHRGLTQFKEAFSRYIPSTPLLSATTPQRPEIAGLRGLSISNVPATATTHPPHATSLVADNPQRGGSVADRKRLDMLESQACCVVADREPFPAREVIDLPDFDLDDDGIPDFDIDLDSAVLS